MRAAVTASRSLRDNMEGPFRSKKSPRDVGHEGVGWVMVVKVPARGASGRVEGVAFVGFLGAAPHPRPAQQWALRQVFRLLAMVAYSNKIPPFAWRKVSFVLGMVNTLRV